MGYVGRTLDVPAFGGPDAHGRPEAVALECRARYVVLAVPAIRPCERREAGERRNLPLPRVGCCGDVLHPHVEVVQPYAAV